MPTGRMVRSVGTIALEKNVETLITISNDGTNGFVIVDALQLVSADG